ncbi:MAG: TetR/AcrR family transcriptional regulator, partial [Endozoicomonas sp.]
MSNSTDIQQLLGIRLEKGDANQVVAWSDLSAHLSHDKVPAPSWMLSAIADACVQNGASRACHASMEASVSDSSQRFFTTGQGKRFLAVSEPLYQRHDLSAWKTSLYRLQNDERFSPDNLIADFNHTFQITEKTTADEQQPEPETLPSKPAGSFLTSLPETVADKRRQQIFRGACDVISRKGFGSATMREIAKAADITIPTMYK